MRRHDDRLAAPEHHARRASPSIRSADPDAEREGGIKSSVLARHRLAAAPPAPSRGGHRSRQHSAGRILGPRSSLAPAEVTFGPPSGRMVTGLSLDMKKPIGLRGLVP